MTHFRNRYRLYEFDRYVARRGRQHGATGTDGQPAAGGRLGLKPDLWRSSESHSYGWSVATLLKGGVHDLVLRLNHRCL